MRLPGGWKWYAALAAFALFTALVVFLPRSQTAPAAATTPPSPNGTADMSSGRPEPEIKLRGEEFKLHRNANLWIFPWTIFRKPALAFDNKFSGPSDISGGK